CEAFPTDPSPSSPSSMQRSGLAACLQATRPLAENGSDVPEVRRHNGHGAKLGWLADGVLFIGRADTSCHRLRFRQRGFPMESTSRNIRLRSCGANRWLATSDLAGAWPGLPSDHRRRGVESLRDASG